MRRLVDLAHAAPITVRAQAMCALTTCPDGPTSVVVGDLGVGALRAATATGEVEPPRRGGSLRRRRLLDLEAVPFEVPMKSISGDDDLNGDLTGFEQAAALIDVLANPVSESRSTVIATLLARA